MSNCLPKRSLKYETQNTQKIKVRYKGNAFYQVDRLTDLWLNRKKPPLNLTFNQTNANCLSRSLSSSYANSVQVEQARCEV